MINNGKSDNATIINCSNGVKIMIYSDSIYSGLIRVLGNEGRVLWQKKGQTSKDLITALVIAEQGIETNIFETD